MLLNQGMVENSTMQFLTVLILFIAVLAITSFTVKWIAGYQKSQTKGCNMELIESMSLSSNKYIQIVRIGEKYIAMAICKDTVEVLAEIPSEQIVKYDSTLTQTSFKDLFAKARKNTILEKTENHNEDE